MIDDSNVEYIKSLVLVCDSDDAICFIIVYDTSADDSNTLLLVDVTLVIVTSDTFKPPPIE